MTDTDAPDSPLEPVVHGSFTIERRFRAPPKRTFAAWVDIETKARWFVGPPDRWSLLERELDLRVGGGERLVGQLRDGPTTTFAARYHAIVPNERLVYVYDMHVGTTHLSVSLATVEFAADGTGTRMTFTEQASFLDGKDGTESRRTGTDAHFDRLAPLLEDPHELVSSRVFDAPRDRVFEAHRDPTKLARWWGPKGFTNTFHEFDLRPGGAWRSTMHGPDGTDHPNTKKFVDVVANERIVFEHVQAGHEFTMALTFVDLGPSTLVTWRMRFASKDALDPIRDFVVAANEENLEKLGDELAGR